jgi:hypothetical protein
MAEPAASPLAASASPPPELDAACVTRIASFVTDARDFGALLRVCRTWRRCGLDPALPFWAELDGARFHALGRGSGGAATPFCACACARAVRRLRAVLRRVDLRDAVSCPACAGAQTEVRVVPCHAHCALCLPLTPAKPHKRIRTQSPLLDALFGAHGPLPSLAHLDLSLRAGDAPPHAATLLGGGVGDAMLARAARPRALPALRTLRLTNNARLFGTCLPAVWAACPALSELYVAGTTLLETSVRHFIAPRPSLRVNLLDDAPLPAAVDVTCGLCAAPLHAGLASFAKAPPTQRHISEEWYTNEAPRPGATAPMHGGDERMLNCARNCHGARACVCVRVGACVGVCGWWLTPVFPFIHVRSGVSVVSD